MRPIAALVSLLDSARAISLFIMLPHSVSVRAAYVLCRWATPDISEKPALSGASSARAADARMTSNMSRSPASTCSRLCPVSLVSLRSTASLIGHSCCVQYSSSSPKLSYIS